MLDEKNLLAGLGRYDEPDVVVTAEAGQQAQNLSALVCRIANPGV